MNQTQLRKKAIHAVRRRGCLLVFPKANAREPASLWSELYPRTRMRWEWDDNGDGRVAGLWHLREQLSRSRQVIYSKWFQGRATLFSFDTFTHLLAFLRSSETADQLRGDSRNALDYLLSDSPLSTKQLKAALELEGRLLEPSYNRALKPLWQRLLIVGYGEFEDSSFPSLGIGSSSLLFEDLWKESLPISVVEAERFLSAKLGAENPFLKFAQKLRRT